MGRNAQFKQKMKSFVERTEANMNIIVRKLALELLSSIVLKSPVDTGRFRGNWFVQVDTAPVQTDDLDKSGSKSIIAGATEIGRFEYGGRIFILNHLPYSIALEYGYSGQAPAGIVRITVAEFQQYVEKIAAGLKK